MERIFNIVRKKLMSVHGNLTLSIENLELAPALVKETANVN